MAEPQHLSSELLATSIKGDTADESIALWVKAQPWRFDCYDPRLCPVLPAVQQFCAEVLAGHSPRWLTILGPSGIGKTLLMKQAFRLLRRRNMGLKDRDADCEHLQPVRDLNNWQAPKDFADHDLLYIEDIGSGTEGKGSGAVIASRTTELLLMRARHWTLLDANMGIRELSERLDPRITSRLKRDGSILIEIPGGRDGVKDYNFR